MNHRKESDEQGVRLQDCCKSVSTKLPPRTSPFVQMADMESVVMVVTTAERRMTTMACQIPAWPTTHDSRKKIITPKMLSRHRIYNNTKQYSYF